MGRETVTVSHTIDAPIDRVWAAISAIGGLERWFPVIETCQVEGTGVGARRICGLANGATLYETVRTIDHAAKRFQYSIDESPLPVSNYLGTVALSDAGGGRTVLSWTAEFDVDEGHRDEMKGMFAGALGDGIRGLGADLERAS